MERRRAGPLLAVTEIPGEDWVRADGDGRRQLRRAGEQRWPVVDSGQSAERGVAHSHDCDARVWPGTGFYGRCANCRCVGEEAGDGEAGAQPGRNDDRAARARRQRTDVEDVFRVVVDDDGRTGDIDDDIGYDAGQCVGNAHACGHRIAGIRVGQRVGDGGFGRRQWIRHALGDAHVRGQDGDRRRHAGAVGAVCRRDDGGVVARRGVGVRHGRAGAGIAITVVPRKGDIGAGNDCRSELRGTAKQRRAVVNGGQPDDGLIDYREHRAAGAIRGIPITGGGDLGRVGHHRADGRADVECAGDDDRAACAWRQVGDLPDVGRRRARVRNLRAGSQHARADQLRRHDIGNHDAGRQCGAGIGVGNGVRDDGARPDQRRFAGLAEADIGADDGDACRCGGAAHIVGRCDHCGVATGRSIAVRRVGAAAAVAVAKIPGVGDARTGASGGCEIRSIAQQGRAIIAGGQAGDRCVEDGDRDGGLIVTRTGIEVGTDLRRVGEDSSARD